jgi:hypothetical protein
MLRDTGRQGKAAVKESLTRVGRTSHGADLADGTIMAKRKHVLIPDEPEYEADIDAQVARLREILTLMAPEGGSAALGAMRRAAPDLPLSERIKALGAHRG